MRAVTRDRLLAARVIAVLRLPSAELARRGARLAVEAGFGAIEVTMTVPGAIGLLGELARELPAGVVLGAGTLLDAATAERCVRAGARFLVSPCAVPGLAGAAHDAGCVAMTGAWTPGEVLAAQREGADFVKLFPASSGGPAHVRAIHAVFPETLLCPTGGIGLADLDAYFAAGAALVGVGSDLLDAAALAAGDDARVVALARRFLRPSPGEAR